MNNIEKEFTYDGNAKETYFIFRKGVFFAEVASSEDNVSLIVYMLNENKNEIE